MDEIQPSKQMEGPELFIGMVGAIGTDVDLVTKILEDSLAEVGYGFHQSHIIELIHEIEKWKDLPHSPLEDRYTRHMDAGDEFRCLLGDGSLAILAVTDVRKTREDHGEAGEKDVPLSRYAYVFRALKQPEGVVAVGRGFGDGFFWSALTRPAETDSRT